MVDLDHFRVGKYRFSIKAKERLFLPPYKGSALRGGFGSMFKEITCFQRDLKAVCSSCILKGNCPYFYVFETAPLAKPEVMAKTDSAPRPFVIEPPLEEKEAYEKNETFDFNLILMGKALDYLYYFILVFKELGREGFGFKRSQYDLTAVKHINPLTQKEKTVYHGEDEKIIEQPLFITGEEIKGHFESKKVNSLQIEFKTGTRIKYQGSYISTPEMAILLRNLLRRLNLLSYFHHNGKILEYKMQDIDSLVGNVNITENDIKWHDWKRYSKRQRNKMDLGGFTGKVVYAGPLKQFIHILFIGSLVHIGKNTTFGLGKYELSYMD